MSVLKYIKNNLRSPPIGRRALSVIFFLQIRNEVPGKKKGLSPIQRATGACRPLGGRHAPFFCQGPRCEFEEKKLHLGLVVLWEGDRGYF